MRWLEIFAEFEQQCCGVTFGKKEGPKIWGLPSTSTSNKNGNTWLRELLALPLEALPLDPEPAEPEEDALDEEPAALDPPREPPPPPLYWLNVRSVVTDRGTLGGGTAVLAGATLRTLGTASRCPSRPLTRSDTAGTWLVALPERLCSGDTRTPGMPWVVAFEFSAFTNRRSARSYTIAELPSPVAIRALAAPLDAIVRATRAGALASANWFCITSRAGVFSTFHRSVLSGVSVFVTPRGVTANNPADKFSGVLPFTSNGCDGTMPTVPPAERIHTPVTGLHRPTPPPPKDPLGLQTQPTPGRNSHPP